ncbi:MAG: hypothetical protein UR52_C0002G0105 [Candidatus Gottesmanbacteria bacterium GW2011_GWA1_34_13]|uniref:Tfp pilus assembly protein PilO n=1 Tax=Candidatus Gottesmanbacteria bacterium GW2011_GWA1_34_13 TaxID=1618434 RepID=A0A0G0DXJ9_9BACT|nr:MAG: hypothetical protein UR52_C0002G0105 [Candidatus Gottesmanbacteria bacterium GW2011_GWA1_34_13]
MPEKNKTNIKTSFIQIYAVIIGLLLILNIAFIIMVQNQVKTIALLKKELVGLEQNNQIISSSNEISTTYTNEIEMISRVFPSEALMPEVIKQFESEIRLNTDNYRLKFNSVTPVAELDRLYLPLTLTVDTDVVRLVNLLTRIEQMPYMTHVNSIISKNNEGLLGKSEITISLKLYVQNPFNSK